MTEDQNTSDQNIRTSLFKLIRNIKSKIQGFLGMCFSGHVKRKTSQIRKN